MINYSFIMLGELCRFYLRTTHICRSLNLMMYAFKNCSQGFCIVTSCIFASALFAVECITPLYVSHSAHFHVKWYSWQSGICVSDLIELYDDDDDDDFLHRFLLCNSLLSFLPSFYFLKYLINSSRIRKVNFLNF